MIPDEAILVARRAIEEATETWAYPLRGEAAEAVTRAVLDAAAHLITAATWDEGYAHGYRHGQADCMKLYEGIGEQEAPNGDH